jgi:uncharacterized damage-inducible protein DinB
MRTFLLLLSMSSLAIGQTVTDNPQLASAKAFFDTVKNNILKAADKMPEDKYAFRPSDDVRTYGELLAHIADGQYFLCGTAKEGKSENRGIEKSVHTKSALATALRDAFAYCDATYAGLTDPSSAAMVSFFGQKRTKLSMLSFNTAHSFEHYGNLATYLRMNRIVPPSSEPQK